MTRWSFMLAGLTWLIPGAVSAEPETCSIRSTRDRQTDAVMEGKGYEFANYDRLCRFLRDRNLRVDIAGDSGVLAGRACSWAYVRLADRRTEILSKGSTYSTVLNAEASSPVAEAGLWKAINNAMSTLASNPRVMAELSAEVAAETARLRRVLATRPVAASGE